MIKDMINNRLKNKKGAFSILAVIVIFIIIFATTAFVDITNKSFTLNEIQGIMDTSGLNALQSSTDLKRLRAEFLAVDADNQIDSSDGTMNLHTYQPLVQKAFEKELNKYVRTNGIITKIEYQKFNIDFTYDKWGQGITYKQRPQIVLDATYRITIRTSSKFDTMTPIAKILYSARQGSNFEVTYGGTNSDGNVELIVRSVTREVLR